MKKIIFIFTVFLNLNTYPGDMGEIERDDKNNAILSHAYQTQSLSKGNNPFESAKRRRRSLTLSDKKIIRKREELDIPKSLVRPQKQQKDVAPSLLCAILYITGESLGGNAQFMALQNIKFYTETYGDPHKDESLLKIKNYNIKFYREKFNAHLAKSTIYFDAALLDNHENIKQKNHRNIASNDSGGIFLCTTTASAGTGTGK